MAGKTPSFLITELSDAERSEIISNTEVEDNWPVDIYDLRIIHFEHADFEGGTSPGSIIMHEKWSENVLSIFRELYSLEFPVHSALPIHVLGGDDVRSMEANNSSGFNCRKVMRTERWSSHAYGAAIDINPVQNPYVLINGESSSAEIFPKEGYKYLNRHILEDGMVEPVVELFADHGFSDWGGYWTDKLDYHHFQIPWEEIETL